MGYSLAVHFNDNAEKKKMESFMKKNFTSVTKILQQLPNYGKILNSATNPEVKNYKRFLDSAPYSTLGYDRSKYKLGYNYSALEMVESYYCQQILSWIAVKSSKKHPYGETNLSVIVLDGKGLMPIYLSQADCDADKKVCLKEISEQNGFSAYRSLIGQDLTLDPQQVLSQFDKKQIEDANVLTTLVKAELERLDQEWKKNT